MHRGITGKVKHHRKVMAALVFKCGVAHTKGLLRAEMVKRGISYAGLVDKLAAIGVRDTKANLRNRFSRGGFIGAFFSQCLTAMGVSSLRLAD